MAVAVALVAAAWFGQSCATGDNQPVVLGAGAGGGGAGSPNGGCQACVSDSDCASGSLCGQFAGDSYCAPDCSKNGCADPSRTCATISGADGQQLELCVPTTNACGAGGQGGAAQSSSSSSSTSSSTSSASSTSGNPEVCGSLDGPDVMAACTSCKTSNKPCQTNGCYGGWWCNTDTSKCQSPPAPGSCGGSSSSSASSNSSSSSSSSTSSSSGGGAIGPSGGTLDKLSFAIVGDTRPPVIDDTAGYPTAVITKIWQDVEAVSPRPAFGISTGDYMFAKPYGNQGAAQMAKYLAARAAFSNITFPALGNHECTGGVASNCGTGNIDGITNNYTVFLQQMLAPINQTLPYYTIHINGTNNAWTAKFVFVAANAWSSAQSTWLSAELSKPTTYTFVVRHEGSIATQAPGVTPSATIMSQHPYTLLLAGHTHTFSYFAGEKQVVTGNGGAPLSSNINYGYVIAIQRADGSILFKAFDYSTNAPFKAFAVKADGTPAP